MWNNSVWEQEHQKELSDSFLYEHLSGGPENFVSPVRRITCEGCGNIFYTRVPTKKYCNDRCAKRGFWKHKQERRLEKRKDTVCKICGSTFTPKRSDAVYCSNACRQKAYRQSVTNSACDQNDHIH